MLGGMPGQMRQRAREMHGVLARAAVDFQYLRAIGEAHPQHFEDGILIAFAGGGKGEHGARLPVRALPYSKRAARGAPIGH